MNGFGLAFPLGYRSRVPAEAGVGLVLSNATDTALGPTSATIAVETTGTDGTVYWVIVPIADSLPSFAEAKAGQRSGGSTAESSGSQAVVGAGNQIMSTKPTMLNPEVDYKVVFAHEGVGPVESNVIAGNGFTTTPVISGQLSGGGNNTTDPTVAAGLVAVEAGDYVFALASEASGPDVTGVTDNLGHTYVAQNVGTANAAVSGRLFTSKVTVPGNLTAVNFAAPASANDIAVNAVVAKGPFGDIDANVANRTDNSTSYTANASGTLAQASELFISWLAGSSTGDTYTANSPRIMAGSVISGGLRRAAIQYINTEATTSLTGSFAGTDSAVTVVGALSVKRAV